jgi:hypothetical protein
VSYIISLVVKGPESKLEHYRTSKKNRNNKRTSNYNPSGCIDVEPYGEKEELKTK